MKVPLIDLPAQFRTIESEIRQAIDAVLTSQKFILDEEVRELEREFLPWTGSTHAISCANGTDALLLSLAALGIGTGDEVITSSYSFFATAGTIAWLQATPVFVDIDARTFNLRTDQVLEKMTKRTKAIVAVHLFGQCCAIEQLLGSGVPVIEDAAQAIGSSRNGSPAGSFGMAGCFSFFPTKNLGAYGDGGMIVTNDGELAKKLKMMRTHGQEFGHYTHPILGTNSRLDELQAAILRVKLRYLEKWNEQRLRNASFYRQRLEGLPLILPQIEAGNRSNFHQFVVRTEKRDELKTYLSEHGIGTAIYYPVALPLQPCFANLGNRAEHFPEADKCAKTSLALPVHAELSEEQLSHVVDRIKRFYH
jgi:dTDP-4-amino-4,6-dideoxygalactose transaminase